MAGDGSPEFSVASALTPEGQRTWIRSEDPGVAEAFEKDDLCGAKVSVSAGSLLSVEMS